MTPTALQRIKEICKNCKHWTLVDDMSSRIAKPEDPDTGEPMKLNHEVRQCKNPKLLFCERPLEKNGFAVADGSEFFAGLYTAEEFGCVLFESK